MADLYKFKAYMMRKDLVTYFDVAVIAVMAVFFTAMKSFTNSSTLVFYLIAIVVYMNLRHYFRRKKS